MVTLIRALFVIAFSVYGCGPSEDAPMTPHRSLSDLLRVTWRMSGDAGATIDRKQVADIAGRAFSGLRPPKAGAARVRLIGELTVADKQGVLSLEGRVAVPGLSFPVVTRIAATGSAKDAPQMTRLLTDGIADVVAALGEMLPLVDINAGMLVKSLQAAEPDVQVFAAKLIGMKKPANAAKAVCPLLKDPREVVAEAATETLMLLRDPSSVSCVIGSISKQNIRSEVRAIEILGHVGGEEAVAYLEMVAGGHELAEVRSLSETLLKGLKEETSQK